MHFFSKVRLLRSLGLGLILVSILAVACGTSARVPPEPEPAVQAPQLAVQPTVAPAPTSPPAAEEAEVNPGKVTWLIGSFANERFHYCTSTGAGHDYARQVHAFLISSDEKDGARVLIPGVAKNWELSADGRTLNLTIRDGVLFNDGTEVTAEDVAWNFKYTMGPGAEEWVGSGCLSTVKLMESVEQIGPDTVALTRKESFPGWPAYVSESTGQYMGIVVPAYFGGEPREHFHDQAVELAYDQNPIGAGIFKLVDRVASESMEMERFEDHYYQPNNGFDKDRRTSFTTLDLRLVPEVATRVAAIRSGEADIGPVTLDAKEQIEAGGGRLVFGPEGTYIFAKFLGCWKEQFPCHDIRVRQALNYTVPRAAMQERLYGGPEVFDVKGFLSVTPSTEGYSQDLDPFPFDPDKARELLAEAGYPGGEGFGKLIINTWISSASPLMPETAQLTAEFWNRELGIDAEVRISEEAAVKKLTKVSEDAHGQMLWRDNETRVDASGLLHGSYGRNPDRADQTSRDPELVEISKKGRVIIDPDERIKALNAAYLRFRDDSAAFTVGYINIPYGVGPRIETWQPFPLAFYPSALHTIKLK